MEEEREHITVYKQHRSLGPRVGDLFPISHRGKRGAARILFPLEYISAPRLDMPILIKAKM